ncbi:hypothetical protein [Allohahella sp. A8]|uniref:hypothetical protein n=1 Tax=Allohahella sp. A8 TaxID=3141461 RepID=UPI003A7FA31C
MEDKTLSTLPSAMKSVDWQAVFAGLVFLLAANWLLFLLGTAIGVSIADASDMAAMGNGLGFGTFIWIILSGIVTYYAAGYMTTRLARNIDEQQGMLQALTLWSSAVVVTVVLAAFGTGGVVSAGQSVLSAAGSIGSSAATGTASAIEALVDPGDMKKIGKQLRREAAQFASEAEAGDGISQEDATQAFDQLDGAALRSIASLLLEGDTDAAKKAFRSQTDLNNRQVDSLVNGLERAIEDNTDIKDVRKMVQQQYAEATSGIASAAGSKVSQQEVQRTIGQLDSDTVAEIAKQLISGDTKAAKATLTEETTLSDEEVESVVDNVSEAYRKEIKAFKRAVDTASSYATGLAWALFLATLASLIAAIFGGRKGVESIRARFPDHAASLRTNR